MAANSELKPDNSLLCAVGRMKNGVTLGELTEYKMLGRARFRSCWEAIWNKRVKTTASTPPNYAGWCTRTRAIRECPRLLVTRLRWQCGKCRSSKRQTGRKPGPCAGQRSMLRLIALLARAAPAPVVQSRGGSNILLRFTDGRAGVNRYQSVIAIEKEVAPLYKI